MQTVEVEQALQHAGGGSGDGGSVAETDNAFSSLSPALTAATSTHTHTHTGMLVAFPAPPLDETDGVAVRAAGAATDELMDAAEDALYRSRQFLREQIMAG